MTSPEHAEIVVAIDGTEDSWAAVRHAAELARAAGLSLRVVHCLPEGAQFPQYLSAAVEAAGTAVLHDVVERLRDLVPGVDLRTRLLRGPRREQLVHAARDARMIVLGRHEQVGPTTTDSVGVALAEHNDRPVRIVPPTWSAGLRRSHVVVAVENPATARDLVLRGFELAADLGQPLELVHVRTDDGVRIAEKLRAVVDQVRGDFGGVEARVRIEEGDVAVVLAETSRRAALLLVGRSSHQHPVGPRVGPSYLLMSTAECPVEVGPGPRVPALS